MFAALPIFFVFFHIRKGVYFSVFFICSYLIKHFHGQFQRFLRRYYLYGAFVLLLLLLLSIMPIDSRTWYARIGVFQSTKIVTQSNSFQKDNLNFTVRNIAFMYNKNGYQVFLDLIFLDVGTAKDKFWYFVVSHFKMYRRSSHEHPFCLRKCFY